MFRSGTSRTRGSRREWSGVCKSEMMIIEDAYFMERCVCIVCNEKNCTPKKKVSGEVRDWG